MTEVALQTPDLIERQRRIRRTVWWLAALAASFYLGFIVMSVTRAHG